MSISFSQIPQIITIDEQQQNKPNSYSNIDIVKMKIPSLQDKFQARAKNEETRIKNQSNKLLEQLEENKKSFMLEQLKEHKALIKQKKLQNYELLKSMGNGQPKHPRDFRKANQELEVFKETGFLLPSIEDAQQMKSEELHNEIERKKYLKAKALQTLVEPWKPTKSIANYFDNRHQMKSPEENMLITQNYPLATKKLYANQSQNNIQSLGYIPMNIQENGNKKPKTTEKKSGKNSSMSQSYVEQAGMKPTSSNNLMLFQQQLAEEKSQMKNIKSMNSLASIKKSHQSMSNLADFGIDKRSKEWINAYHQKEIFSRPLYNNLDIKLQGNNPHFKPFKPTKTQGYNFNQYISLEAGERDNKSANLKKLQEVPDEATHFENEPMFIKPPKQFSSLNRIEQF